mgnify:CR=1 FL=1
MASRGPPVSPHAWPTPAAFGRRSRALALLGLPKTQHGAGGIADDAERAGTFISATSLTTFAPSDLALFVAALTSGTST